MKLPLKVRNADGTTEEISDSDTALEIYRHSTSHLMAAAVCSLFPGTHLGIGPAISDGFYYDFDRQERFVEADLETIEAKMRDLIAENLSFEPVIVSKEEAIDTFTGKGENLKVELIRERAGERVSCYRLGDVVDFCTGPHLAETGLIDPGSFHVLNLAGSYWRGDENNRQLQRIYGAAFFESRDLADYVRRLEEAKKRDHRKLGREFDLFSISEEAGPGLVFWHPKGTRVRHIIEDFLRKELYRRGYEFVTTPHVARDVLWKTSGHYEYYRQNMYAFHIDDEEFVIRVRHQADELSGAYPDLQDRHAELPGSAAALRRIRDCVSIRKKRCFARDAARARIHSGRCAYFLYPGPGL